MNIRIGGALRGTILVSAFSLAVPVTPPAAAAAASAMIGRPAESSSQRVIVVLRDQRVGLPMHTRSVQRRRAVTDDQAPLVEQLKRGGATHVSGLSLVNAIAATVNPTVLGRMRNDPQVAAVVPDLPIRLPSADTAARTAVTAAAGTTDATNCPRDPAKPLAEPEALHLTKTDAAQRTATGRGVKIAFFADGIDVNNPEFIRPDGSHVITDYQDFSGDGTNDHSDGGEAFGDASAIAAQGSRTYDLSTQLPHAQLPKGCTFRIRGLAPGAELMSIKAYGENGGGSISSLVRGIQYAVEHHADVLSQSFMSYLYPDAATNPIRLADQAAVAAGVTVVAASGDSGTSGTVGAPASDPAVIGVGASTSFRLAAQAYGYPRWASDNVSALSSGGTTQGDKVVDLVAPGMVGMAACTVDPHWKGCTLPTQVFGGSSQSAPFVAGAAADVIQEYKETHGGTRPAPDLVKRILTGTATDLRTPADEQGAGLVNTDAAVQAARAIGHPGGRAQSTGLVPSAGQLGVIGRPGSTQHADVALTNTADRPQRVTMTSRTMGSRIFRTQHTATVGAPLAGDDREGRLAAKPFTFRVPGGTPLLDAEMVWPGTSDSGKLALALVDPAGRLTQLSYDYDGYGRHTNYQHVDVHDPRPGTWTVKVLWNNGRLYLQNPPSEPGSYRGPVKIRLTGHRYASAGVPGQTRVIPAGATATFPVKVPMPQKAGDAPFSLQFASDTGTHLSLPVACRSLIPTDPAPGHSTSFAVTITGGVGRDVGQTNSYYLDVPPGRKNLTIDLTAEDSATQLLYYLISPDGQVLAKDTDRTADENSVPTAYAGLTANRPAAGRWTLVVQLPDAVSGREFSQQVTGKVHFEAITASAPGLPNSPTRTIRRGSHLTVSVKVPNPGPAQQSLFLDPRLDTMSEVPVPELGEPTGGTAPINGGGLAWIVPTHTTRLVATATADRPVDVGVFPLTWSPEVYTQGGLSNTTAATTTADQLAAGAWVTEVSAPFTGRPADEDTAHVSLDATTQTIDSSAKASTGDPWDNGPDWKPVSVAPGTTATMTITLTPTAPVGTVVRGTLYVDTHTGFPNFLGSELIGSELTGIPYTYTVS
ncbi:S8 family serine peptidase [Streptomyces sp. NPDC002328]|uniref:S8 family peptidase n=1 Tax=Streptomyces sp. NPDC002328 TaxID=3364642 RepID=UPI0036A6421F